MSRCFSTALHVTRGQSEFANRDESTVSLKIDNPQLWSPEKPVLYDLSIEVASENGALFDQITSYAGLREVAVKAEPYCSMAGPNI